MQILNCQTWRNENTKHRTWRMRSLNSNSISDYLNNGKIIAYGNRKIIIKFFCDHFSSFCFCALSLALSLPSSPPGATGKPVKKKKKINFVQRVIPLRSANNLPLNKEAKVKNDETHCFAT